MASPGRSPLDNASPGIGERTEDDRTRTTDPPSESAETTSRATRTTPRKTLSNAATHASSGSEVTDPAGGPPELSSAPSSRPKLRCAVLTRSAAAGGLREVDRDAHGHRWAAQRGRRGVDSLLRAGRQHDPGAFGDQDLGGGQPQASAASGHDVDAVLQS